MEDLKKLLLRSYDDDLNASEKKRLEKELSSSEELRIEKKDFEAVRKLFGDFDPHFQPGFSDRILQKIDVIESMQTPSLFSFFKGIAISGVAAIIALLISIYLTDGSLDIDAIYGISDYAPDEAAIAFFNL